MAKKINHKENKKLKEKKRGINHKERKERKKRNAKS
jgi:hypothetical protein